jgi:gas vesicle protein
MKPATIHDIKQELTNLPPKKVLELCLRLARYKKENKELLTYLLFESTDDHAYVETIKKEIDDEFIELPKTTLYLTKKSLRKLLKSITKYSKHIASKQAEAEMLIYFCAKLKSSGIPIQKSTALTNMYKQQLKKISAVVDTLHEDLHFDYRKQLQALA